MTSVFLINEIDTKFNPQKCKKCDKYIQSLIFIHHHYNISIYINIGRPIKLIRFFNKPKSHLFNLIGF